MLYRAAEVTLQKRVTTISSIANKDVDKNTAYENYGDDLAWGWGGGWGWRHGGFRRRPGWGGFDYTRPINFLRRDRRYLWPSMVQKPANNPLRV